jgi:Na+-driven multidrug efflux pump
VSRHSYLREIRPTLVLALPIAVGQVSQMLMGITDSVMIGQTGTVPLAASAFGGNVFSVFYVMSIGLMLPVSVLVSRARGAWRWVLACWRPCSSWAWGAGSTGSSSRPRCWPW